MSWERRILARDRDTEPGIVGLPAAIEGLFAQQAESWEQLAEGIAGLTRARSRVVRVQGHDLVAWHIPHRIGSTTARTDDFSIEQRPCFLCPQNLPDAEGALALDDRFVVTCNPYPILGRHLSIVSRDHRPQLIAGASSDFRTILDLSAALPEYLVLYNGPECGASAPDHMHLQACHREGVPITRCLDKVEGGLIDGFPSSPLVVGGQDPGVIEKVFLNLLERLRVTLPGVNEPMLNIIAIYEAGRWQVFVFPRTSHRPQMYHSGELTWSPGALDLAGIVVLPVAADMERVTGQMLERGFGEVSLSGDRVVRLARELELA